MNIYVGTTNPVKLEAVTRVVNSALPESIITSVDVPSDVGAQPMSDEETKQGSINRAKNALANRESLVLGPERSLGIGLEGGVFITDKKEMWNTVWVSVIDTEGNSISVNGCRFRIPQNVAEGILAGEEMGIVAERISGIQNVKHKEGFIGYMTNNVVDRATEYAHLVSLAVGLWIGKKYE